MANYRVSRYLMASDHEYTLPGGADHYRMVYATRTGSLVALPSQVVDHLQRGALEDLSPEMLDDLSGIEAVIPDGLELDTVLSRQRAAVADRSIRQFVLMPTGYCNMGCAYCGQEHVRGRLPNSHRDAVLTRVLTALRAPGLRKLAINWFGAEPMMGYPAIQYLSERFIAGARAVDVDYGAIIVTNGTLLTVEKIRALCEDFAVRLITVTLDGPARVHDQHRPLKNGGKSFDRIVGTLRRALHEEQIAGLRLVLRTNIDVENCEWVDEYLDTMADLGFGDERVSFNLAPVYSWGNDVSDREIDRKDYSRRETAWMRRMVARGLRFEALPGEAVGTLCIAVSQSSEIVSSSGAVFSCSEYPLVPQHEKDGGLGQIGDLDPSALRPTGPFDDWHDSVKAGRTPCQTCLFQPVCGGACPKQWREGNVPCPPYKFAIQERFDLAAIMNGLHLAQPA